MNKHPIFQMFDRPIAFHRSFVTLTGSITAALMLSQAIYWSRRTQDPNGWFYKTQAEWEGETGMTRREQETARKKLRQFDWWQEELHQVNGRPVTHYRIDMDGFAKSICTNAPNGFARNVHDDLHESAKSKRTNAPNPIYKDPETTTETTTETTGGEDAAGASPPQPPPPPDAPPVDFGSGKQPEPEARTPRQQLYAAICEACGWDYRTLGDGKRIEIAEVVKRLDAADYTPADVERFMVEVWPNDWRYQKRGERPTPALIQQEIGKLRAKPLPPPSNSGGGASHPPRTRGGSAVEEFFADLEREGVVIDG